MGIIQAAKNDAEHAVATYKGLGITASMFSFFQGRSTFFALFFTAVGTILAFEGKLTVAFVSLIGAIQTLIVVHSYKEDWFAARRPTGKDDDHQ
jgi:hypothetical protein